MLGYLRWARSLWKLGFLLPVRRRLLPMATVSVHGYKYRIDVRDRSVAYSLYIFGEFETHIHKLFDLFDLQGGVALDIGANLDYRNSSSKHTVAFGGIYNATHVDKTYAVTLQPGNFLAPIFTPGTPDAAYTVVDASPNVAHLAAAYIQDSWKMGQWQLDYGLRGDSFGVSSPQFGTGF